MTGRYTDKPHTELVITDLELLRRELFARPGDDVEPRLRQNLTEHLVLVAETGAQSYRTRRKPPAGRECYMTKRETLL